MHCDVMSVVTDSIKFFSLSLDYRMLLERETRSGERASGGKGNEKWEQSLT